MSATKRQIKYQAKRKAEARAKALCPECAQGKPTPGFKTCDHCRELSRARGLRARDKKRGDKPKRVFKTKTPKPERIPEPKFYGSISRIPTNLQWLGEILL